MRLKVILLVTLACIGCGEAQKTEDILPGAYQTDQYFPLLKGKKVGLTVNQSSMIGEIHLVDSLLNSSSSGIRVTKVFTPEHGFKGTISDGESIEYDQRELLFELISLYGKTKKPTDEHMRNLDVMIFDIQDVGTRFYTYISTLHYVMEACAENHIPLIILDRPNPNGSYVDGPVLDTTLRSFVGMHPIPIVHGMSIGELAHMINGEGWLNSGLKCELRVIPVLNWDHQSPYSLPVKPSPNLPNDLSISLYPSLCLFEGTVMSVGRGTDYAFQQIGHPNYPDTAYSFIPQSREGAKWPPFEDQRCYGVNWIQKEPEYLFTLEPLIKAYQKMDTSTFFNSYFKRLAGTEALQIQIESGMSENEIRATWKTELEAFKTTRNNYLLYP